MGKRAFTLAESIFAITILGLMALGLVGLFLSTKASTQVGINHVEAMALTGAELQRWKAQPYPSIVGYLAAAPAPYNVTSQGVVYQMTLSVQRLAPLAGTPDYDMLALQMEATWMQKKSLQGPADALRVESTQSRLVVATVVGPEARF